MRLTIFCFFILINLWGQARGQDFRLNSPDQNIEMQITYDKGLFYSLFRNEETLVHQSSIDLLTDRTKIDRVFEIVDTSSNVYRGTIKPLWGIASLIKDDYNQLIVRLDDGFSVEFRAYNDGVAWRFLADCDGDLLVINEKAEFNLPLDAILYWGDVDDYCNPFECNYPANPVADVSLQKMSLTPIMYQTSMGTMVIVTESDLHDYPGLFVRKKGTSMLMADFPKYPLKESEQLLGRLRLLNLPQLSKKMVRKTASYIAHTSARRSFPWRVLIVGENEGALLEQNLVYQLARPAADIDFSWVIPGKVVWDWYNHWSLEDTGFKPGINTLSYRYMIDFAADNNLQYVNIDDGWAKLHNFNKINKNLDLKEVISYATQRGVGIIVWCTWQMLEENTDEKFDYFKQLGVAGLKIDFFDRCDQHVVSFITELAQKAADRQLVLNLHGVYKPTGLQRTYPNVLNFEGVLGLEYNKFSDRCTPEHNTTIPFIRNAVGPMDYTPGGMHNVLPEAFEKSWKRPVVMTTKAHQAAMYVVYHGGLQMLADAVTDYEKAPVMLNFLREVPISWEETKALKGEVGKLVMLARRKGDIWYVGCLNADASATVDVPFSFLPGGTFKMQLLSDGVNGMDLKQVETNVSSTEKITIDVNPTSGFVAIFTPIENQ